MCKMSSTLVCGKIIGYQNHALAAFPYHKRTINSSYVYGVSLTHGENPRQHIWTFAGAMDESSGNGHLKCFCVNDDQFNNFPVHLIPSYVGTDYFCDTALGTLQ